MLLINFSEGMNMQLIPIFGMETGKSSGIFWAIDLESSMTFRLTNTYTAFHQNFMQSM